MGWRASGLDYHPRRQRYFGLKDFQGDTLARVTQGVLLTHIAVLAVALAAQRYQRPDLLRRRGMVLAHV